MQELEALGAAVEPVLKKSGIDLLELTLSRHRGSVQVRAVVFSAAGTGTKECSKAHRIIQDSLMKVLGVEDPYIEVMSPGIDRVLKTRKDYEVFAGQPVRIRLADEDDWTRGRLLGVEGDSIRLKTDKGETLIALDAIAKARLDSKREGE